MTQLAIEVQGLCKTYRRGIFRSSKQVLDHVTFNVPMGTVFGFLGHNGAGKSTTIKSLLNFTHPDKGNIRVLGKPAGHAASRAVIGFLPETADYYPFLTPRKLLTIYGKLLNMPAATLQPRTEELLIKVGLEREINERIGTFSKGMKQRVGIAQALLNDPQLLILDEPASGLDPLGQREIRDLIIEQKKAGKTIFFSSHELAEVEAVCDEAVIIRRGQVVASGTLQELIPYREQVEVRLRNADAEKVRALGIVEEIRPQIHPGELSFVALKGRGISELSTLLEQHGFEIAAVSSVRDSLEETFVRLMKETK